MDVFYLIIFLCFSFQAGKMSSKSKFKTGTIRYHKETLKYLKVPFLLFSFFSRMSVICDISELKLPYLWQVRAMIRFIKDSHLRHHLYSSKKPFKQQTCFS